LQKNELGSIGYIPRPWNVPQEVLYCYLDKHDSGHDSKFFNYPRMNVESFDQLLQLIRNETEGRGKNFRQSICPEEKLVVTLK
jgi:hypothetical protein